MSPPQIDYDSMTWSRLAAFLAEELQRLRGLNDSTTLDIAATNDLRGQIKFAKRLLGLPYMVARDKQAGSVQERPFGEIEV